MVGFSPSLVKDAGEQTLIMENPERPLDKRLTPEKELMHYYQRSLAFCMFSSACFVTKLRAVLFVAEHGG